MKDYHWTEMMENMQDIRLFSGLHIRRSKNEGITSSQELDLLSRIVLSNIPMTPHSLCSAMGLSKSAVSRLIEHLEKKEFLYKKSNPTDKRSYSLLITEKGNEELNLTYAYYLEPIYQLRRVLGDERFESLTTKIKEANELLLKEKGR